MEEKEHVDDSGVKKKVDESWKESVGRNKQTGSFTDREGPGSAAETQRQDDGKTRSETVIGKEKTEEKVVSGREKETEEQSESVVLPEPNFSMFISGLGMQVLMHLGELENPVTGKKEKDTAQAKYVIDILGMLKEKTKNNLSAQESGLLDSLLYDLRMKYVSALK